MRDHSIDLLWRKTDAGIALRAADEPVGVIARFADASITCEDGLEQIEPGVLRWTRSFTPTEPWEVLSASPRLTMDIVAAFAPTYWMIPGVSYHGNAWGSGDEPRGLAHDGTAWSFAAHRTAVAGGTYSEGSRWSLGLFAAEGSACSCSLLEEATGLRHRLIWPEEEQPLRYASRDAYEPGYRETFPLSGMTPLAVTAYVVVQPVERPRTAWRRMLDVAWRLHGRPTRPPYAPDQVWSLGITFARESLWAEEGCFRGFSVGLWPEDGQWRQRPSYKYEIGWCGQNASLAVALLDASLRDGDAQARELGLAALDCWVQHALLESGLMRTTFDPLLDASVRTRPIDACNLGGAAEHLFEAAGYAERCGVARPAYAAAALTICDRVICDQDSEGRFARAWDIDGHILSRDGTVAAYLIPALLAAYRHTDHAKYLDSARRAFGCYVSELRRHGFTTAGALDTDCIDKESAAPLLSASLDLYDATGADDYLTAAVDTAYYLASWQWHHSVAFAPGTLLSRLGYDTFGGTAVSAQHHHIDPWAVKFVPDWLRLADLTGDATWHSRAQAAWTNGMLGVSDGTLVLDGVPAPVPAGGQPEGYFHTRWHEFGDVSRWLVAWPTAFRLETLRRLEDWSVLEGPNPTGRE